MVKVSSSVALALLATAHATPTLRSSSSSSSSRKLAFDLDLPFIHVHVKNDSSVDVSVPGVQVHRPANGTMTVKAPFTDVRTDEKGNTVVKAPGVEATGDWHGNVDVHQMAGSVGGEELPEENQTDDKCKTSALPEAKAIHTEPTCEIGLPDFYSQLFGDRYHTDSDKYRVSVMDGLCHTACGPKYTSYLLASRAQDLRCGGVQVASKEGLELGKGEGLTEYLAHLFKGDHQTKHESNYRSYPGLNLGCLKAEDGKYCAVKKGLVTEKGGCEMYLSCCWGSYLKGLEEMDEVVAQVEKRCPGSLKYASKPCKR